MTKITTLIAIPALALLSCFGAKAQDIKSVKIGNQTWTKENLSTDKFSNGDPIQKAD